MRVCPVVYLVLRGEVVLIVARIVLVLFLLAVVSPLQSADGGAPLGRAALRLKLEDVRLLALLMFFI